MPRPFVPSSLRPFVRDPRFASTSALPHQSRTLYRPPRFPVPALSNTSPAARHASTRSSLPVSGPRLAASSPIPARHVAPSPFAHGASQRRWISDDLKKWLDTETKSTPVLLFMKGTPQHPQCGFSRAVVQVLQAQDVPTEKVKAFNVLEDPDLREGIKEYSNWPTVPQLYVAGEFVGGSDIVVNMHQSGELAELFKKEGITASEAKKEE